MKNNSRKPLYYHLQRSETAMHQAGGRREGPERRRRRELRRRAKEGRREVGRTRDLGVGSEGGGSWEGLRDFGRVGSEGEGDWEGERIWERGLREEKGAWEEKGVQLPGEAGSRMLQVYTPLPGRSMPRCHGNLPGQPPGGCQAPPTHTSGVYADRATGPV